jgi:hypothetical protein
MVNIHCLDCLKVLNSGISNKSSQFMFSVGKISRFISFFYLIVGHIMGILHIFMIVSENYTNNI